MLDRAYIVYERYEKRREVFNKLHSLRYRFMARFGRQTEKPFIELHSTVSDIFNAADILGSHYWQRQGREKMKDDEFKTHLEEMHEQEAIFWYKGEKRDKVGPKVEEILRSVEVITEDATRQEDFFFKKLSLNWLRMKFRRSDRAERKPPQ